MKDQLIGGAKTRLAMGRAIAAILRKAGHSAVVKEHPKIVVVSAVSKKGPLGNIDIIVRFESDGVDVRRGGNAADDAPTKAFERVVRNAVTEAFERVFPSVRKP